jgi:cardiolipin synthase
MPNIPNILSILRLVIVVFLVFLAWNGKTGLFLLFFLAALLTDMLDGYLARRLKQESELGAKLDSWGDFALYMTVPLCVWHLWPEIVKREILYVSLAAISYALPVTIGFVKYRRLTSYHTWGAKLSAVLMGASALLLFAGGPAWPFRISTAVLVLAELEEIAITTVMPVWRANIPSLFHALTICRDEDRQERNNPEKSNLTQSRQNAKKC